MDATLAAVLLELDGIFTLKKQQGNSTEGFSRWTTLFQFNPDWLGQESRKTVT